MKTTRDIQRHYARTDLGAAILDALRQAGANLDRLRAAGFRVTSWDDLTEAAAVWFQRMRERPRDPAAPPTGPRVILGSDWDVMTGIMVTNFEENRLGVVRAVLTRSGKHAQEIGENHA